MMSRSQSRSRSAILTRVGLELVSVGAATGGKGGSLPPPPTSDRGPPEIDTIRGDFGVGKKWG